MGCPEYYLLGVNISNKKRIAKNGNDQNNGRSTRSSAKQDPSGGGRPNPTKNERSTERKTAEVSESSSDEELTPEQKTLLASESRGKTDFFNEADLAGLELAKAIVERNKARAGRRAKPKWDNKQATVKAKRKNDHLSPSGYGEEV